MVAGSRDEARAPILLMRRHGERMMLDRCSVVHMIGMHHGHMLIKVYLSKVSIIAHFRTVRNRTLERGPWGHGGFRSSRGDRNRGQLRLLRPALSKLVDGFDLVIDLQVLREMIATAKAVLALMIVTVLAWVLGCHARLRGDVTIKGI